MLVPITTSIMINVNNEINFLGIIQHLSISVSGVNYFTPNALFLQMPFIILPISKKKVNIHG